MSLTRLRALRSAATRLNMARRVLRGGREHADMGGAVCSVAAGHGRNWGQGAVTACYGPLLLGTREVLGKVAPLITIKETDGKIQIPSNLLSLVRPLIGKEKSVEVIFYNSSDSSITFSWQFHKRVDALHLEETPLYTETLEANQIQKHAL